MSSVRDVTLRWSRGRSTALVGSEIIKEVT
jgi:hypothetical protein